MNNKKISVGSICSGIEAASVAFKGLDFEMKWFSEIADFPSKILNEKYPKIQNIGDMCHIPEKLKNNNIQCVDMICGGTPCQAFSLAGLKKGLIDKRGNLTLKFIDIIKNNDQIREQKSLPKTIVLWENVEGVLRDKTNAFSSFISELLGLKEVIDLKKWPSAGAIHGIDRNIAWRVLDAKYFGVPQQRKRVYLIAGDKNFFPENILFDKFSEKRVEYYNEPLNFNKNGFDIEVYRDYSDCLYSAYGTKWNGNAAAYNGSLFVSQNKKIRRLTPLECERLMGFPDNYTNIKNSKSTARYQAIGNSWAIPVITFIATKLEKEIKLYNKSILNNHHKDFLKIIQDGCVFFNIPIKYNQKENLFFGENYLNGSTIPQYPILGNIKNIIEPTNENKFFISKIGCQGILRRSREKGIKVNLKLEKALQRTSINLDIEN